MDRKRFGQRQDRDKIKNVNHGEDILLETKEKVARMIHINNFLFESIEEKVDGSNEGFRKTWKNKLPSCVSFYILLIHDHSLAQVR